MIEQALFVEENGLPSTPHLFHFQCDVQRSLRPTRGSLPDELAASAATGERPRSAITQFVWKDELFR